MSQTLQRLLTGVLTGKPVSFRSCDSNAQEQANAIIPLLPMPLSQRQQQAIRNAWSSDLSYVQGPPGTGKSHTIAAMMLSALLLDKRMLLVSHKQAAIDVVRSKLTETLGEELAIYVGADAEQRSITKARVQNLIDEVQSHGFRVRLDLLKENERGCREDLEATLRQAGRIQQSISGALKRANAVFHAHSDHLRARDAYSSAFNNHDLTSDVLSRMPPVAAHWQSALDGLSDLSARRASGAPIAAAELLRGRLFVSAYRRRFATTWSEFQPWDVHRIQSHHAAVRAFDRARDERSHIDIDLNKLRVAAEDLRVQTLARSKKYLRTLVQRTQLENAAKCIHDLSNFAALFRLRAPRLVRPRMDAISYANVTRVFPLWLGELRHLGAVLPLQPNVFDLAVVDEASQVNIAEIVPAFYRASGFVVVGDRNQLGLEAAGLFALNRTFEELAWNNAFGGVRGVISYQEANQRELAVSTSSILDFVLSPSNGLAIPKSTLDEHFRSMPPLAAFTSSRFYANEGGLKVMTEVGHNLGKNCFRLVEVGGKRSSDGKYVMKEVDKAIDIVESIALGRELGNNSELRALGFSDPSNYPTVGVISFTTMQRDILRERAEERLDDRLRSRVNLLIGTPEEFQGNERDVMILTFALGEDQRYGASHYEKPTRFNVATSRARKFTYAVIGRCPTNANLLRRYFASFGFHPTVQLSIVDSDQPEEPREAQHGTARLLWRLDERLCESEFERLLLNCLHEFVDRHSSNRLKLFNQVTTCGQKRIDFVVFDEDSTRSVAVEVDGPDHFCEDGRTYHHEHMERSAVLRRAGWHIVHVPYFRWYRNGWIYDREDSEFENVLRDLYESLRSALSISTSMSPRRQPVVR